jgi:hypothetical protein
MEIEQWTVSDMFTAIDQMLTKLELLKTEGRLKPDVPTIMAALVVGARIQVAGEEIIEGAQILTWCPLWERWCRIVAKLEPHSLLNELAPDWVTERGLELHRILN